MKHLLFILISFIALNVSAQKFTNQSFNTALGDMKMNTGTNGVLVSVNGLSSIGDDNAGFYRWDAESVAADDGFKSISVIGVPVGRWMRVGSSNTINGSATLSGALLTTSYVVPFGTTLPFVPITVIPTARTAAAAQPSWISNITNTSFTINFITVPVIGTLNMVIDWVAIKQK